MAPRSCPSCHHANRQDCSYCSQCGSPLGHHCSRCGFFAESEDVYCGGCGANFFSSASEGSSSTSTSPRAEASPQDAGSPKPRGARPRTTENLDLKALQDEASKFRTEIEKQDQMDQGDIDALFSDS